VEAVREAYNFHNLQSFLDIYYEGASTLLKTTSGCSNYEFWRKYSNTAYTYY
jgi:adenosine deaminase